MFGLTSTLDGWPFFPGFDEFSTGKNEKNPVLKGFDPLGINAQGVSSARLLGWSRWTSVPILKKIEGVPP